MARDRGVEPRLQVLETRLLSGASPIGTLSDRSEEAAALCGQNDTSAQIRDRITGERTCCNLRIRCNVSSVHLIDMLIGLINIYNLLY